jgi:GntP family gluconate:H+ symporter
LTEFKALYLLAVIVVMLIATEKFRMIPFLALVLATSVFALLQGGSLPWTSKEFNTGFGQTIAASGLAILAGAMVARLAEGCGAIRFWREHGRGRGGRLATAAIAAVAGVGGTPIAALAILAPVLRVAQKTRTCAALIATYAVNATHGSLVPSPLPIAALAILGGDWRWALAVGAPVALVQIVLGMAIARRCPTVVIDDALAPASARGGYGLAATMVVLVALLICQSLGQIPSEPLGGGNARENLLGLGRPMLLLLFGLGVAIVAMGPSLRKAWSEDGWIAEGARSAIGVFLAIGAAGGVQMVLHNTGMAALLAERVLEAPPALGVAVPFLVAFTSRVVQGSALTAVITAAGMMQPMVAPLGMDGEPGRALVAVAIGVGAMAGQHLNDGYFWMASHHAGLRAAAALRWITGGALAQGVAGLLVLTLLSISLG